MAAETSVEFPDVLPGAIADGARASRRLAAILAADVVGYSRMMAADETGTLHALKRHREDTFNPAIGRYGGRVVKLMGDGTLVEFGSVVDAVQAALDIQHAAAEASQSPRIVLRIGINLGDVIIDGDDIYGDGVNIAARLEPLSAPGGICVSSIVHESVRGRVDETFDDGGDVQVKNIERPIRVWQWRPGQRPEATAEPVPAAPKEEATEAEQEAQPDVSIAVLPFDNMSGDPEQEYFSDGISEDIITDLSKVSGLTVIARNSSFAYKGKSPDLRVVGRELGVTSILEGSIRRAGNRVRINAQLIDAGTGAHVWADRFDRDLTDIFEVQDEVTRRIVNALRVKLTPDEKARLSDVGTTSVAAHDFYLKARELTTSGLVSREIYEKMKAYADQAVEADPNYAAAWAGKSLITMFDYHNRWTAEHETAPQRALELAKRAVALDENEPTAFHALAVALIFLRDDEAAEAAIDRALKLNPNFAPAYSARGTMRTYAGRNEEAVADIEKAMRLDPLFTRFNLHSLGFAHLVAGNFETAAMMFTQRIRLVQDTDLSRSMLASALGHLGETEEARRVWGELPDVNPDYDFEQHMARLPFKAETAPNLIREGLVKAGILTAEKGGAAAD